MIKRIKSFIFEVRLVVAIIRPLWRTALGRWYVFRDTPRWVLEALAATEQTGDDLVGRLISEAIKELQLRDHILRREGEKNAVPR